MNVRDLINRINTRGDYPLFNPETTEAMIAYVSKFPHLTYLGHGGMALCFVSESKHAPKHVVKCCRKNPKTIVSSKQLFLTKVAELRQQQLKILYPLEVLYEDQFIFVYSQPMCHALESQDVTLKIAVQMLDFIESMIKANLRMTDIYYRNFGIYHNQLVLFDFHEIENWDSTSNFLINNLYSNLILLGKNSGWHKSDKLGPHLHFPLDGNLGEYRLPNLVIKFLQALKINNKPEALDYLDRSRTLFGNHLKTENEKLYRGRHHTDFLIAIQVPNCVLDKYQLAVTTLNAHPEIHSIWDARGGGDYLGVKLAQDYPNKLVSISCDNTEELAKSQTLANNFVIYNIKLLSPPADPRQDLQNQILPHPVGEVVVIKYDLVVFYGLVHHLLRLNQIEVIIDHIHSHVGKYCLIEVPLVGDHLLDKVMKSAPHVENYRCLASPETFRYNLVKRGFKVHQFVALDYCSRKFLRYAYVCSV